MGYPVGTGTDLGTASATAALMWADGQSVAAPSWSGLMLSVEAKPGQELTTGTVVTDIDGITRLAVASSTPFYRPLAVGDKGADVVMLRAALGALDLGSYGTSQTFDAKLQSGIGKLCQRLGCPASTTQFDPSWFVFLPADHLTVATVSMTPARPAPAAGQTIITTTSVLQGMSVAARTGTSPLTARFPDSGDGMEFVYESAATPLTDDFHAAGSLASLAKHVAAGTPSVEGSVQRVVPITVSSVPTTSLVTGANGDTCVYPYTEQASATTAVVVHVVGGEPGMTKLGPITLDQVLVNPADLAGLPPCP